MRNNGLLVCRTCGIKLTANLSGRCTTCIEAGRLVPPKRKTGSRATQVIRTPGVDMPGIKVCRVIF